MPLVSFKPAKARLVVEQGKGTVLVLRIATARDENVLLSSGGTLQALTGIARVREHDDRRGYRAHRTTGSIVFVPEAGSNRQVPSGKYQVNIAMASDKFNLLLQLATAGRLPAKFFVEIGVRSNPLGSKGFGYVVRSGRQVKLWDTTKHRMLPVTGFTMIFPVELRDAEADAWSEAGLPANPAAAPATNAQVAELADELLVFQSETKHMLNGLVIAIIVICVLIGAINLVYLFR
jgi:hypothetical protein